MKKFLLIFGIFALLMFALPVSAENFYVNETAWKNETWDWNYTSTPIQDAINNASAGDIINVYAGMYYGGVVVDKALTFKGEDIRAFLDCNGSTSGFNIKADGVEIYGFNIYNCTYGINASSTNNSVIKACTIHDNTRGINITDGSNNKVAFCNIYNNSQYGIFYGNFSFNYTTNSYVNGWYINAEYNYWNAEKGPVYCLFNYSTGNETCVYSITNVTQGDKVVGADYTPWLRAKVFNYTLADVNGINQTIDAKNVADTELKVTTNNPTRVFVVGFWGNPGTDFVTSIGRYVGIEFNQSSNVVNMTIDVYYTYDDQYGKKESSAKMYYWNGKVDSYWLATSPTGTLDTTDSGIYTGHLSLYLDNSSTTPKANATSDVMLGIGMYSDPIGGIALPADNVALMTVYAIGAVIAAIGVVAYVRRH